jgi:hypothetical protein
MTHYSTMPSNQDNNCPVLPDQFILLFSFRKYALYYIRFSLTRMSTFYRFNSGERIVQLTEARDSLSNFSRWIDTIFYGEGLFIIFFFVNYFTYMTKKDFFHIRSTGYRSGFRGLSESGVRARI